MFEGKQQVKGMLSPNGSLTFWWNADLHQFGLIYRVNYIVLEGFGANHKVLDIFSHYEIRLNPTLLRIITCIREVLGVGHACMCSMLHNLNRWQKSLRLNL